MSKALPKKVAETPEQEQPVRTKKVPTKPGQPRSIARRKAQFEKNVENRGNVTSKKPKDNSGPGVGPVVIGFFLFVVVGSAILQIIRTY